MMFYSTHTSPQQGWTASHLLQLKTGCNLRNPASGKSSGWGPCGYAGPYTESQEREMQACWDVHGEAIMEEYDAYRPEQRPWYWWRQRDMELPEDERTALRELNDL